MIRPRSGGGWALESIPLALFLGLMALAGPGLLAASLAMGFESGVRLVPVVLGAATASAGWWVFARRRPEPRWLRRVAAFAGVVSIGGLVVQLPLQLLLIAVMGLTVLGAVAVLWRARIAPVRLGALPGVRRVRSRRAARLGWWSGPLAGAVVAAVLVVTTQLPPSLVAGLAALALVAALATAVWRAGARPSARAVAASAAAASLALVPFRGLGAVSLDIGAIGLSDVAIGVAIVAWFAGKGRSASAVIPRYALGLGLFVTWLGISGVQAVDPAPVFKELAKWGEITLAVVVLADVVRTERWRRWIAALVAAAVVAQVLLGLAQTVAGFGPGAFAIGGVVRAFGTFDQPNPYGGYLGLHAPLALAALLYAAPRRRWLHALLWLLIVAAIIASRSRGAWLGLGVSTIVVVLAAAPRVRWGARIVLAGSALTFLMVASLQISGVLRDSVRPEVLRTVEGRLPIEDMVQITVHENYAVTERVANWVTGWHMFLERPVLGVGAGNFDAAFPRFRLAPFETPLGHAHNVYVNFAAEAGLVALLAIVALTAWALVRAGRVVGQVRDTSNEWLAIGALGALSAFAVHNLVDSLFVSGMGLLFALFVALGYGLRPRPPATARATATAPA